ncbi:hypothetical protein ACK307_03790 [Aeromonas caviae]
MSVITIFENWFNSLPHADQLKLIKHISETKYQPMMEGYYTGQQAHKTSQKECLLVHQEPFKQQNAQLVEKHSKNHIKTKDGWHYMPSIKGKSHTKEKSWNLLKN